MRKIIVFCIALLSVSVSHASLQSNWLFYQPLQAGWVIYQPQTRDMNVPDSDLASLFNALKLQGAEGIVLQWSKYGNQTFYKNNVFWLGEVYKLAEQANLKVIIGLSLDFAYFDEIKKPAATLDVYLEEQAVIASTVVDRWLPYIDSAAFAGWYITEEIDDYHWMEPAKKASLIKYLHSLHSKIEARRSKGHDIYLSAYLGGFQTPQETFALMQDISLDGKIKVWMQDGIGTQNLSPAQREYYYQPYTRDAMQNCTDDSPLNGWVYEYFRQQPGAGFSAISATAEQWDAQQKEMSQYCSEMKLIFSLRYLLPSLGILEK